jgi:predicted ATP-grasp superfamily ATP-dependent carboligase
VLGPLKSERVLIAGVSTRAAAESAARAGFGVTSVDAFADLDQHPSVRSLPPSRPFDAITLARGSRDVDCDAVAYLSTFENHPRAVDVLSAGRALWGNSPATLRRVRDPVALAGALRGSGLSVPRSFVPSSTFGSDEFVDALRDDTSQQWLLKPLRSGGGHGVRLWRHGAEIPTGCYLQELIEGTPGSVVFIAARNHAVPLGVLRQLIGEDAFGTSDYRYCGNILVHAADPQFDTLLVQRACALTGAVAEAFDVVGVNGIDFVARDGVPFPVEVNPRWCASLELIELAYGLPVFGLHAAACDADALPDFDLVRAQRAAQGALGKAVVFARHDVTAIDTRGWLEERDSAGRATVRDIPRSGARIGAGLPVCTVFAAARNIDECHEQLVRRAEVIHAQLAVWNT